MIMHYLEYVNRFLLCCDFPKFPLWEACDVLYIALMLKWPTSHPAPSHKLMQPTQEPADQDFFPFTLGPHSRRYLIEGDPAEYHD